MNILDKRYLIRINKTKLLKRKEEINLFKKLETDFSARQLIIESNLKLVVSIAKKFSGIPLMDLIQEGTLGLIEAVERFDYKKGFKFSTFATPRIKKYIKKALSTGSITKIDERKFWTIERIETAKSNLNLNSNGANPDIDELAREVKIKPNKLKEYSKEAKVDLDKLLTIRLRLNDHKLGRFLIDFNNNNTSINLTEKIHVEDSLMNILVTKLATVEDIRRKLLAGSKKQKIFFQKFGLENGEFEKISPCIVGEKYNCSPQNILQILYTNCYDKLKDLNLDSEEKLLKFIDGVKEIIDYFGHDIVETIRTTKLKLNNNRLKQIVEKIENIKISLKPESRRQRLFFYKFGLNGDFNILLDKVVADKFDTDRKQINKSIKRCLEKLNISKEDMFYMIDEIHRIKDKN